MNDNKSKVVLQRVGDPSPVTIDQDKCLIRTRQNDQMVDCCAIFNGPHGTALRSYSDKVLVNGEPTSAQFLRSGDEIQLPCATRLQVRAASQYRPFEVKSSVAVAEQSAVPVEVKSEQLNAIFGGSNDEEEVFHSPFSSDLTSGSDQSDVAVESPATDEPVDSTPEPSLESRMSAIFNTPIGSETSEQIEDEKTTGDEAAAEYTTSEEVAKEATDEPLSNELESVMQRLGVLNTSTSNPVEVAPVAEVMAAEATPFAEVEPVAEVAPVADVETIAEVAPEVEQTPIAFGPQPVSEEPPFVQGAEVQPSYEQPALEQPSQDELVAPQENQLSQQLQSIFANVTEPTPDHQVPVVESELLQAPAEPVSIEQEPESPVTHQPLVDAEPTFTSPVSVEAPVQQSTQPVPERSVQESIAAADPLSELPTDLRNQLNDLVSSLEMNPTTTNSVVESETAPTTEQEFAEPQEPTKEPNSSELPGLPSNADAFLSTLKEDVVPQTVAAPEPVEVVEPEPEQEPEPVKPTSVADILGSMGMAIPGMDENETQASEPAGYATEAPVEPTPEPVPVETPQPVAAVPGGAEEDIQAYMDRLLNRSAPVEPEPVSQEAEAAAIAEAQAAREPVQVLSPEEFVPTHKAARHESFNELREIANTSSRSAIRVSTSKARTESIIVKSALFLLSFAGAVLSYQLQMAIPAIAFVGAAFATSYLFYQDYKRRETEMGAAKAKLRKAQ